MNKNFINVFNLLSVHKWITIWGYFTIKKIGHLQ